MENKFEYTYSAPENAQIEKIRRKYASQTAAESKLGEMNEKIEDAVVGGYKKKVSDKFVEKLLPVRAKQLRKPRNAWLKMLKTPEN